MGLGFVCLHTTLQLRATEISTAARGKAFSLFIFCLFTGISAGSAVFGRLVDAGHYEIDVCHCGDRPDRHRPGDGLCPRGRRKPAGMCAAGGRGLSPRRGMPVMEKKWTDSCICIMRHHHLLSPLPEFIRGRYEIRHSKKRQRAWFTRSGISSMWPTGSSSRASRSSGRTSAIPSRRGRRSPAGCGRRSPTSCGRTAPTAIPRRRECWRPASFLPNGSTSGGRSDQPGGHHLLQRSGRCDRPRLQRHPRRCPDHHARADLLDPSAGGGSPRLVPAEHVPVEPLLRLGAGPQRTGAEGEEPPLHRRHPRHQSRQPHRVCLPRGDAPADRGDRPEIRPVFDLRRDVPADRLQREKDACPCRTSSGTFRGSA